MAGGAGGSNMLDFFVEDALWLRIEGEIGGCSAEYGNIDRIYCESFMLGEVT